MNDNDYARRQAEKDREYAQYYQSPEYRRYLESLSPAERHRLEADGLLAPLLNRAGSTARDDDAAELDEASVGAPNLSASDSLEAILADYPHLEAAIEERARKMSGGNNRGDILASFCAHIRGCANPAMVFDAVCYATGVSSLEGQSATELAAKHGVTRQAFSKIAVEWCETFGLQPSRSMKSKTARRVYRDRAKRVHERRLRRTTA